VSANITSGILRCMTAGSCRIVDASGCPSMRQVHEGASEGCHRHVTRLGVCCQGAQSMGGLMTLHAVLRHQSRLRGVVLTSALINVQYTPILRQGRLFEGFMHVERMNEPRSNRWSRAGAFIAWFGLHSLKLGAAATRMQRPCSPVAGCILCSEGAVGSG